MSNFRFDTRLLKTRSLQGLLVMFICALTLALGMPALAGDDSGPGSGSEVEFEALIQEVIAGPPNGPALRFGPELVRINLQTEFRDNDGDSIPFSAFQVGQKVRVKGFRQPDNSILAKRIEQRFGSDDSGFSMRHVGIIQQILPATRSLIVNGIPVHTNNSTIFLDDDNNLIAFEDLSLNDFVEVEGQPAPIGPGILAKKVKLDDDNGDDNFAVHFRGIIQNINLTSGTLVVAQRFVVTGNATIILDDNNNPISLADLAVGDFVQVEGMLIGNGAVFAKKIKIEDFPDDIEVEFRGVIEDIAAGVEGALSPGTMIVSGRIVYTNNLTIFLGLNNEPLTFGDFAVGEFVEVEGARQNDGSILAEKIKKEDRVCARFEIRGPLTARGEGLWVIGDQPVHVTNGTKFLDQNNEPILPSAINIGDFLEAEGCVNAAGEYIARKIKLEDPDSTPCPREFEFSGVIREILPLAKEIIVDQYRVSVTPGTEITGPEGRPLRFADLRAGMNVKVEGVIPPQVQGGPEPLLTLVIACEIKVRGGNGDPALTTLIGVIESIDLDASTLVCSGTTVLVSPETIIRAQHEEDLLTLDDLTTGLLILAKGRRVGDGTFAAAFIKVIEDNQNPRDRRAHIFGLIRAINLPESITVRDVTVLLRDNPEIETWLGEHITPDALSVGDLVEVKGFWTPERELLAKEIHVCAAVISDIDYTSKTLLVSGTTVAVTDDTDIVTSQGAPMLFEDLMIGDLVRIRGSFDGDVLVASLIMRLDGPRFSGPIGGLNEVEYEIEDGKIRLRANGNVNNFGFVDLPGRSFCADVNVLVCVDFKLSTDAEDIVQAPSARVRANAEGLRRISLLRINSTGDARYAPTHEGRPYRFYFVPSPAKHWNLSFDLLNFDPFDDPDASLTLEGVRVVPIPLSAVRPVERLADHDFNASSSGWNFGGAAPFSEPQPGAGDAGTLDLTPPDPFSFGTWFRNLEIDPQAGAIYRARFVVRAAPGDPGKLPVFRMRFGVLSTGLVAINVVNSVQTPNDAPGPDGRVFDLFLAIPPDVDTAGDPLFAGFDIMHFDPTDDSLRPVSLDHFVLDRVEIAP